MAKKQSWTTRVTFYVGIFLAVLMGASLVAPALTPNTTQQELPTIEPTVTVAPEYPDPITDFSTITFDQGVYMQPTGLFTVGVPSGWQPSQPFNNSIQAQANFNNPDALSVIESYVQNRPENVTDLESLSAQFTFANLGSSWQRYTNWQELDRTEDTDNERLTIDFRLERGNERYFAQQAAWFDDDYIYVVRVVTPENATELLFYMVEAMIPQVQPIDQFRGTPVSWNGYYDEEADHFIRHPQTWRITDSAPGLPTSIEGGTVALRIEAQDTTISDEDAAREFVSNLRAGVEIATVEPINRPGGEGFSVSYNYRTPDGVGLSGIVVMFNGEDDSLHIANATVQQADIDLNAEEAVIAYPDLIGALETFSILPDLNFYEPPPPPTPPATPTPAPVEATEEAADEAEATPAADDSAEDGDDEAEATPEATEEG